MRFAPGGILLWLCLVCAEPALSGTISTPSDGYGGGAPLNVTTVLTSQATGASLAGAVVTGNFGDRAETCLWTSVATNAGRCATASFNLELNGDPFESNFELQRNNSSSSNLLSLVLDLTSAGAVFDAGQFGESEGSDGGFAAIGSTSAPDNDGVARYRRPVLIGGVPALDLFGVLEITWSEFGPGESANWGADFDVVANPIPEPASVSLWSAGCLILIGYGLVRHIHFGRQARKQRL